MSRSTYSGRVHLRLEPEEFDFSDASHGLEDAEEVSVEVEAGSVVFFNGYLLHRSLRNASDRFRRVLVNHYCNAWSLLPWAASPLGKIHLFEIATHDERNIVPIGEDPYAWKGYADAPDRVFLRPYADDDSLAKGFKRAGKKSNDE